MLNLEDNQYLKYFKILKSLKYFFIIKLIKAAGRVTRSLKQKDFDKRCRTMIL